MRLTVTAVALVAALRLGPGPSGAGGAEDRDLKRPIEVFERTSGSR